MTMSADWRLFSCAARENALRQFEVVNSEKTKAATRAGRIWALSSPITEVLGAVALAAGVVYTLHRVDAAELAPELVISFLAALLTLYQPAKNLSRIQGIIEPGRAALSRVRTLLERQEFCPAHDGDAPPSGPPRIIRRRVV